VVSHGRSIAAHAARDLGDVSGALHDPMLELRPKLDLREIARFFGGDSQLDFE
jgi:hypothetical protein